jgi:uncharacterized membrane protein
MSEQMNDMNTGGSGDITSEDKLFAALGYPIPIIPIAMLLMEDKKNRPFLRYHSFQSLVLNVAIWIVIVVVSIVTLGLGGLCAPLIWLVVLWPAIDSYGGKYTEIPGISSFIRSQGWAK